MLKPGKVRALGAMVAATGLKVALLETDGHGVTGFGPCLRRPLPPGGDADAVELALADVCAGFEGVDLLGLGATPLLPGTSAPMLAQGLGWPVVSEFSASDQQLGGLGAPIEAFFHHAMVRAMGVSHPVAMLDLRAVASLTYVDPRIPAPEHGCQAFHAGPGMAALDARSQACRGLAFDPLGTLAATGEVVAARLEAVVADAWFRRMPPRILTGFGPVPAVDDLADADALATLAAGVAAGVVMALEHLPKPPSQLWVTGGGRHHAVLMAMLEAGCDCPVGPLPGLDPGAVAPWALAYLAARVSLGLPTTGPRTTGVAAPVGGGTLHRP